MVHIELEGTFLTDHHIKFHLPRCNGSSHFIIERKVITMSHGGPSPPLQDKSNTSFISANIKRYRTIFYDPSLNGTSFLPPQNFAWLPEWCCPVAGNWRTNTSTYADIKTTNIICLTLDLRKNRHGSVSIMTRLQSGRSGFDFQQGFLFSSPRL
jgi:hypothetical protein